MATEAARYSLLERAIQKVGAHRVFESLTEAQRQRLRYEWRAWARPKQIPPGEPGAFSSRKDWRVWFLQCGRGFGKSRTGAETVRAQVAAGRRKRIALVAPTLRDAKLNMVEGKSGILSISPPGTEPEFNKSDGTLEWPNGSKAMVFTAEEPERLRGWEHDFAWCDELGSWKYPKETWNNLRKGMRITGPLGDRPQIIVTTTPRTTELVLELTSHSKTEVTIGSTFENEHNLDEDFIEGMIDDFAGTRLGDQELMGILLMDTPGALWKRKTLERCFVRNQPVDFKRVVVAVDPAVTASEESDEVGIVVAGLAECMCQKVPELHGFVLDDYSGKMAPEDWAKAIAEAYDDWLADKVVAETNQGGALVESNIRTLGKKNIAYKGVHAKRGKELRAGPVATLYARRKVHHVGRFGKLEDQMRTWNPLLAKRSPDRLDALVYAITELMLEDQVGPSDVEVTVISAGGS